MMKLMILAKEKQGTIWWPACCEHRNTRVLAFEIETVIGCNTTNFCLVSSLLSLCIGFAVDVVVCLAVYVIILPREA